MNKQQEIKEILRKESGAIEAVADRLDQNIDTALDLLLHCRGKLVITGMGKTGIIGRKISATFASTGTPSIYLHPAEAIHGDLGMVDDKDVVIMISNSGETAEMTELVPYFKRKHIPIICLTGNTGSSLGRLSDVVIDIGVPKDAEPLGLVPMASTTTALAMGNALATVVLHEKKFCQEDFAVLHPGGVIGKRLLLAVEDLMHKDDENPVITEEAILKEAILIMTSKGLGCVNIINEDGILTGIITDGDLRRIFQKFENPFHEKVKLLMTKNPQRIHPRTPGIEALELMEKFSITMLPVVDENDRPVAMLHMHDLVRAGLV
ncbi:MAG TPA: KpsF/GutQ family sugar-phosphate isomerase [Candidatus Cloacimonetes bacterium]|nr:KpsF/GutQ family sugar-phosphate isomerase [Candidatus Cloacimonadota bacterium]HEX37729.1 KpsF/GutQ family sugar-phosphate isomerase [Candidatus Cloacimonadota bacterium]